MKKKFWLWLCRLAYKKLDLEVKNSNGTLPDGIPGLRSVGYECSGYAPRKRDPIKDYYECNGDGHYLCKECALYVETKYENDEN